MSLQACFFVIVLIFGFVLFGGKYVAVSLRDVRLASRGATRLGAHLVMQFRGECVDCHGYGFLCFTPSSAGNEFHNPAILICERPDYRFPR